MIPVRRSILKLALAALACGTAACTDSTTGPAVPATAVVSLVTPSSNDGALLITLSGPGLSDIQPANSFVRIYWRLVTETEARVVVVGNLTAGPVFTVRLSDARPERYTASLGEVADRTNAMREALAGYTLTLAVAPQP